MIGSDSAVTAAEVPEDRRPAQMVWRDAAAVGKVDLLLTMDFRNTSTTLYSDIVFPAATWYEKNDLSSTDMHPFVHSFDAAIDPPWEARTDYQAFRTLAGLVSQMAVRHLGTQTDVVAAPISHDTPDEPRQPRRRRPGRLGGGPGAGRDHAQGGHRRARLHRDPAEVRRDRAARRRRRHGDQGRAVPPGPGGRRAWAVATAPRPVASRPAGRWSTPTPRPPT